MYREEAPEYLCEWIGSRSTEEIKTRAEEYSAALSERLANTSLCREIQGEESASFRALFDGLKYDDDSVPTNDLIDEDEQESEAMHGDLESTVDASLPQNSTDETKQVENVDNLVQMSETLPDNLIADKQHSEEQVSLQNNAVGEAGTVEGNVQNDSDCVVEADHSKAAVEIGSNRLPDEKNTLGREDKNAATTETSYSKRVNEDDNEEVKEEEIEESAPGLSLLSDVVSHGNTSRRVDENQGLPHMTKNTNPKPVVLEEMGKEQAVESASQIGQSINEVATFKEMTPLAAVRPKPSAASKQSVVAGARSYLADSARAWGGTQGASHVSAENIQIDRTIPYEELKAMRADSGIDMTCKERYLSDEEFVKIFKKERSAFLAQPFWRQQLQKKDVGLW